MPLEGLAEVASVLPVTASVGGFTFDNGALATFGTGLAHDRFVGFLSRNLSPRAFFLEVGLGGNGHSTIGIIAQHIVNDVAYLLFQFADELLRVVGFVLNVAQILLPDAREFTAFGEWCL